MVNCVPVHILTQSTRVQARLLPNFFFSLFKYRIVKAFIFNRYQLKNADFASGLSLTCKHFYFADCFESDFCVSGALQSQHYFQWTIDKISQILFFVVGEISLK